ncbi:archaeal proteasome endopeptidase complex subunit beta [Candidatus Micrarchaeota archaeon]|nr:archaeal proteasome endopeptidase complex subunit beta [Candidatus Micrarchaeota archaeon]
MTSEVLSSIAKSSSGTPLKGTTTVGITFKNGVVLAADKRASMGNFIASKAVDKIFIVGDKLAITIAGGVGDAQLIVRLLKAEIELYRYGKGKAMDPKAAATLLSNVLQGNKYFPYLVQLIVAGYNSEPGLFDLDPFGGLLQEKYVSTGSGSITAYGVLDEHFREDLSQEDAVKLAVKAVDAAMKRDSATGEGIDAVVITDKGAKRVSPVEINALLKK